MDGLYGVKNKKSEGFENSFTIDLEGQSIGNHEDADKLITALLQGNLDELIKNNNSSFSSFQDLHNDSFYDILNGKTFKEEIGLYYMEDLEGENENSEGKKEEIDDVNKTRKRIITYTYKSTQQPDDNG